MRRRANAGVGRRAALHGAGIALLGALAGCSQGAGTDRSNLPSFGGWLKGTSNYEGVVDRTGNAEVTVRVGAEGNGGHRAFDPAAVRVDPGTTVVWEWTGQGAGHDVAAKDGSFRSELTREPGHTFDRAFEAPRTVKYKCTPHAATGMVGVVVVGERDGTESTTRS